MTHSASKHTVTFQESTYVLLIHVKTTARVNCLAAVMFHIAALARLAGLATTVKRSVSSLVSAGSNSLDYK